MQVVSGQTECIVFGFDSAWTDNPKAPGAIAALGFDAAGQGVFHAPELVSFAQAAVYVHARRVGYGLSLIALDQPSVVPNAGGMRPAERVAASVLSYTGGGVQPANRGKHRMFGDHAPLWRFLDSVEAWQEVALSRRAVTGHFLIEVFPALALAGLHEGFAARLGAPKYNPQNRKTYRHADWGAVCRVAAEAAARLGVPALATWFAQMAQMAAPGKGDQDRLDAALCVLIGLIWRAAPEGEALCIGDARAGYIVTPVSAPVRARLAAAAARLGVFLG